MARWHHADITATLSPQITIRDYVACYNAGMSETPEATNNNNFPLYDSGQADDAITTTAYSVTVRQASELFRQAGFPYSDDHISRLCKQGVLRATQQTTKNKLKRYVIDPRSIDELIAKLRREKEERENPQVFEAKPETVNARRHDDGI